jgi:hypothetical protein
LKQIRIKHRARPVASRCNRRIRHDLRVASAQGLGAISGAVVDPTGAAVPSASVILTRVKTGETVTVETRPDGSYVFPSMSPADYKLDITAPGFKKYEQGGVTLLADQASR